MDYTGKEVPAQYDNANWCRNFITWLSKLNFEYNSNRVTLDYQITEMELLRKELLSISNTIRKLMRSKKYNKLYYLLRSVTGIGPLTAASLLTEIGDMKRFKNFYHLNSFIGLMPMEHSSGERELKGRITVRKHHQLRSDLVECAWTAKRTAPALALYYSEQIKRGKNGKAVPIPIGMKVASKLLSRIRYVWLSAEPYQPAGMK